MKGITFERERKGYSVEQVHAYINVLQENYKKVTSTAQKADDTIAELEQRLLHQKEKFEAANRQFEEEKKQQQVEQQQLEHRRLELKQQLESQKMKNSKLNQQIDEKDQEINQLRDQMSTVEEERNSFQEQLKAKEELSHDEKVKRMPEHLTELYTRAQEQADAYVEQVKRDLEAERDQTASEGRAIIARAEADAGKIEEAARLAKYNEFEEAKERLKKEHEEQMTEIAYLKQEAEAERTSAKEEAESIIRQAQLKLNLTEEKERICMEKALSKSQRIETQMEEQYQQVHRTLTDSAKRLVDLFEYIANINEAKSIEEIRKYGKENTCVSLEQPGVQKNEIPPFTQQKNE